MMLEIYRLSWSDRNMLPWLTGNEAGMWLLGKARKGVAERCQSLGWGVDTILERMDGHMEKRKRNVW